jgi:phosphoenolpyruvate carboxykinase (GTP)
MSTLATIPEFDHPGLTAWIGEMVKLCEPEHIEVYKGTDAEYDILCVRLIDAGTFRKLSDSIRPSSYLAESDPADTARVEEKTFICSKTSEDAGPTNHWVDPGEMRKRLTLLFKGAMKGRTMYVVPYSMGPVGSPMAKIGIEVTDSAYVVVNMHVMTRTGDSVLEALGPSGDFVCCLHSSGKSERPKVDNREGWPCDPDRMTIAHFPEERMIWSYGSGYGGNALLNKKCFALRIASVMARDEGWLAEHMMILSITDPCGKKKYFAGAFPSACGKTNLAMLESTLPGWKVRTVGDDIAWMKFDVDGILRAINAEAGFFGVATNTSYKSNTNAMRCLEQDTIFTNCALTPEGDIWWEGIGWEAPAGTIDWKGNRIEKPEVKNNSANASPLAHPNSRFTVRASSCPSMDEAWEDPTGVPISAIIFGGRRSTTVPLVYESRNWNHGVFLGASLSSETTAAATGQVGRMRRDPFAMLPFCGYNIGDYFTHWLSFGRNPSLELPRIFHVNWFRKDERGRFLWPGYSDNARVLKWIFERCDDEVKAVDTPIGYMPASGDFDVEGLDMLTASLEKCFTVPVSEWKQEVASIRRFLTGLGGRVPGALFEELAILEKRIEEG